MMPRELLAAPTFRIMLLMAATYSAFGVALPFLARWLKETHALNGLEIALVLSSAQMTRFLVAPLIAAWADGFADRARPMRLLMALGAALYAVFFFVEGFWALLIAGFLAQAIIQSLNPLVEGAALRLGGTDRGLSYGVSRGLGSTAFIVGNLAGGALIARFGISVAVAWILAAFVCATLIAWFGLKPDPAPQQQSPMAFGARLQAGGRLFARPAFAAALLAGALIQSAHGFYYAFSTLIWSEQGIADGAIGGLWAFGVGAEVAFLWLLSRIEKRLDAPSLLLIGAGAAVLRWCLMALQPDLIWLWPLQALHAFSFAAAHVGALRLVQQESPAEIAGLGLTLYSAATATSIGLSQVLSGFLYDRVGVAGYWVMAMIAGLGLLVVARAKSRNRL
jgi:PPP family 3-phenylpropionic acid transporter